MAGDSVVTIPSLIGSNVNMFSNLPPELVSKLDSLLLIFKAVGIAFLIYLVFLIIKSILNIIEKRRIKYIYKKVDEMDQKLDKLLEKQNGKSSKIDKLSKVKLEKTK